MTPEQDEALGLLRRLRALGVGLAQIDRFEERAAILELEVVLPRARAEEYAASELRLVPHGPELPMETFPPPAWDAEQASQIAWQASTDVQAEGGAPEAVVDAAAREIMAAVQAQSIVAVREACARFRDAARRARE